MQLNGLDWLIVILSLVVGFLPAIFYMRRAGRGTSEFFASGRAAPWWLIGTSMVATTFSTDTPNLVTNMVRTKGVADNWEWWAFLLTGMMTVFFFARLWRRSGVLTDLEFYELRYAGRSAAFLRGFRALYLGLFFNCVIMASVTLAAAKIANVMLGWPREQTVLVCAGICIVFASISGLWGVLVTDLVQFVIAMIGVFAAAYYALQQPQVGGLAGLLERVDPNMLRLVPDPANYELLLGALLMPLLLQWWSVWYPGAEPGGGSYIAQRMLAARSERDALAGTLWFNIAHYALRPWPWILVALASLLVFPELADIQRALPHVSPDLIGHDLAYPAMLTLLPHGLIGLLVAALLAAYVSTMATHLNWGGSYLVHDFYRRFMHPRGSERHYVWVSRGLTVVLMTIAGYLMFYLDSAKDAFNLMLSIGAGTGLIYLLRWYWWRVNAWSEIAGMIASFLAAAGMLFLNAYLRQAPPTDGLLLFLQARGLLASSTGATGALVFQLSSHWALFASVCVTTIVWLLVTFLTPATDRATLIRFYRLVRPAGPGWRRIAAEAGAGGSPDALPLALLGMLVGCAFVYAALFGTGSFIYGRWQHAVLWTVVFAASGLALWRVLATLGRTGVTSDTKNLEVEHATTARGDGGSATGAQRRGR